MARPTVIKLCLWNETNPSELHVLYCEFAGGPKIIKRFADINMRESLIFSIKMYLELV